MTSDLCGIALKEATMIQCDSCDKWLDGQDEFFDHDEGILCPECATEWYGEEARFHCVHKIRKHVLTRDGQITMLEKDIEYLRNAT
jgi:hypothetical protein